MNKEKGKKNFKLVNLQDRDKGVLSLTFVDTVESQTGRPSLVQI